MRLLKIFLKRFLTGIPIGVFIGQVFFTISICVFKYTGVFTWQNVLINNSVAALIGGYCYGTSVIYAVEIISPLQQTLIQWISLLPFIPIAWIMNWMPRTRYGIIYFILFYFIWIVLYWYIARKKYKKYVNELNEQLISIKNRVNKKRNV